MKRSLSVRSLLAVSLVLAGCSRQGARPVGSPEVAPEPEIAPESVPVLAIVELPSGRSLGTAAHVLDAVQPGMSQEVAASISTTLTSAVEVDSLNGADLDKPVRVVVLDSNTHPKNVLLLVSVSNAGELATAVGKERLVLRENLGLIGAPEAARAAHDYAFRTLARREAPAAPRATVYVQAILASYRDFIEMAKTELLGPVLESMVGNSEDATRLLTVYIDSLMALAEQTDRVEAYFAGQDAFSGVELLVHARPETTLARFNQAQAPSDLALVERLPAQQAPVMVVAGTLALGPARQAVQDFGLAIVAAMWGSAAAAEMDDWLGPWMDQLTGRFAASGLPPGSSGSLVTRLGGIPQMVQLIEVRDGAQAASHTRKLLQTLAARATPYEFGGMKETLSFTPEAFAHGGVTVMRQQGRIELDESTSLDSNSYFAGVDRFLGITVGEEQGMRQLIDAVRGKAPRLEVGGVLGQAMAAARARKDSGFLYVNLGAWLGEGAAGMPRAVAITFGFDETRTRVFLAVAR